MRSPLFPTLDGSPLLCPSAASHGRIEIPSDDVLREAAGRPPRVTVITPFYELQETLPETAMSIRAQTLLDLEYIIVDDGSPSPAARAAAEAAVAADPRARLIRQENGGPSAARNHGARHARADILVFMEADDLFEPTFAEKAVLALASRPDIAWVYPGMVAFGEKSLFWQNEFVPGRMFSQNVSIINSAVRKSAHDDAGGFDEGVRGNEDWDYWFRLMAAGHHGLLMAEPLSHYRVRPKSLSTEIKAGRVPSSASTETLEAKFRATLEARPDWGEGRPRPAPLVTAMPRAVPLVAPFAVNRSGPRGGGGVLIVTNQATCGGADLLTLRLAGELVGLGAPLTVAFTDSADHGWLDRHYALTPDVFPLGDIVAQASLLPAVCHLIETRRPDRALFTQSLPGYAMAPALAAAYPDLKMFDYLHSTVADWRDGGYPRLSAVTAPVWTRSFCNTHALAREMAETFKKPSDQIEVYRTGIDTEDEFNPARHDRAAARAALPVPPGAKVVLHVSRLSDEKRPRLLPTILAALLPREPDAWLVTAGGGEFERERLVRYAKEAGVGHRVAVLPESRDVAALMAGADALLLPSRLEGLSLVMVEAMSMGLPVVASDAGANGELLDRGVGWKVPMADRVTGKADDAEIAGYVEALTDALAAGRSGPRAGDAARAAVVSEFSIGASIRRMAERMLSADFAPQLSPGSRAERLAGAAPLAGWLAHEMLLGRTPAAYGTISGQPASPARLWDRIEAMEVELEGAWREHAESARRNQALELELQRLLAEIHVASDRWGSSRDVARRMMGLAARKLRGEAP